MRPHRIKAILKSISFLYWFMLLSLVTFIIVSSVYVSNMGFLLLPDLQTFYIVNIFLILILIVLAPVSYIVPQRHISTIDRALPLDERLLLYRTAMFIRFLTMTVAGIFVALGFMLTGQTNLIFIQVIVLLFYFIYKPSPFKIASDLDLNEKEKQQLMPD